MHQFLSEERRFEALALRIWQMSCKGKLSVLHATFGKKALKDIERILKEVNVLRNHLPQNGLNTCQVVKSRPMGKNTTWYLAKKAPIVAHSRVVSCEKIGHLALYHTRTGCRRRSWCRTEDTCFQSYIVWWNHEMQSETSVFIVFP